LKSAKDQLREVFVQMKLTVVSPDNSEETVPKISEYADTQNKVNAADFFSNQLFYILIEQFSRKVIFTARKGKRHDTKCLYERSRGQFLNARVQLTFAQQKKFAEFAKEIGEAWSKIESNYDALWYRRLISKAIIYKWLETEVPKQPLYEGGYRANIFTYTMPKVFTDANGQGRYWTWMLSGGANPFWRRSSVPCSLLQPKPMTLSHILRLAFATCRNGQSNKRAGTG
jgi:hypothetical protein